MKGITLYELNSTWIDTLESVSDLDGEEKEEAILSINETMTTLVKQKSEDIIKYVNNLNSMEQAIKEEKARLDNRLKEIQAVRNTMDKSITKALELIDTTHIDTSLGTITKKKCPLSVELSENVSLDDIPSDYIRVKTTKELDKNAIKDVYKTKGVMIKGIKYNDNNTTISYK